MARFEIVMPKLGESIIEATITKWLKGAGEQIEEDDPIVEIATDKVDSEIPCPVEGKVAELLFEEGDVVAVGKVIAYIETDGDAPAETKKPADKPAKEEQPETRQEEKAASDATPEKETPKSDRFYSPLVKSIAKQENIGFEELESIPGTGKDNRVTKADILEYLKKRTSSTATKSAPKAEQAAVTTETGDKVVEMGRMRKLIADHMVMSKQTSPHVTSFIDVDVTNVVNWRNKVKDEFLKREGEKITFTPIFLEAAAKVLKEFPGINASVDGDNIILKSKVNIGMATALPDGNLIVPVIRNADQKNLLGITKDVNDLASRARRNNLMPEEIQGGTFTVTNFGSFDSITGTPIINQPQVAILGIGAIRKQAVVLETENGDVIAVRHIMILSLAYDHRIVDGALGGMYLKRLKEVIENFDKDTVL